MKIQKTKQGSTLVLVLLLLVFFSSCFRGNNIRGHNRSHYKVENIKNKLITKLDLNTEQQLAFSDFYAQLTQEQKKMFAQELKLGIDEDEDSYTKVITGEEGDDIIKVPTRKKASTKAGTEGAQPIPPSAILKSYNSANKKQAKTPLYDAENKKQEEINAKNLQDTLDILNNKL